MKPLRSRRRAGGKRKGAAAVELAICLPVIVLLVLGSIECCSMLFIDEALHVASYEAIRQAIQEDAEAATAIARGEEMLEQFGIEGATVTCEPEDLSDVESGEQITIIAEAPCDANTILPSWFFAGATLQARVAMVRE
jgi:hypothetical protein